MDADSPSFDGTVSRTVGEHVDRVCNRFEHAWQEGQRPRLEDYLGEVPGPSQLALLRELILLDIDYRRWKGEEPTAEDYLARFPSLDPAALVQALAAPRAARPRPPSTAKPLSTTHPRPESAAESRRIRCPHCHNPITLSDDRSNDVLCPGCGSSFQLRDTHPTSTVGQMRPLGKYQLLERVGLGAFGAVWRARDTELDRIVALKIPHTGLLTSPTELERFHREARAAAQLRHPNIVAIHDVALLEGLPVIVSDFITGVPLRDLLEVRRLTFTEAAALTAEAAEALHYAHGKGLVHRDIKPANIMLEFEQDPAASAAEAANGSGGAGRPRPLVMDFGLALREQAEVAMTLEGQIIGTPAYMSPEQAAGHGHSVDGRCDVYSLGVVLYELLAGELPFRGSKVMIIHQVMHEEPRPLRRLNDKVPRDLETICLKALAKEPRRRYATAQDLADDLRRFLKGEPIRARPVGRAEQVWRWCGRNRGVAGLLAALVAVLVVGFAGVTVQWLRAEDNWTQAVNEKTLREKYWQHLQTQEKHQQEHLANLRIESRKLFETGVEAYKRKNWPSARHDFSRVLDRIDAERESRTDVELIALKNRVVLYRAETLKGEARAAAQAKLVQDQLQALQEVKAFRRWAGEMQFYAASTDKATENIPYFDPAKAEQAGKQALTLADGWGPGLATLQLTPEEKTSLKRELHDLLLLLVQARSQRAQPGDVGELQALLERARALRGPSRGYYRLRSQCFVLAGDKQKAAAELKQASAVDTPPTALDHFLEGETYRTRSLRQGNDLGQGAGAPDRDLLTRAVACYRQALQEEPGHYWARFQLGRCYLSLGRPAQAAEVLDACVALRDDAPWGYSATGMALALMKRFPEAKRYLTHPKARAGDFLPARLNLGVVYYLEKDFPAALAEFDAVLDAPREKRLVEAYYYRGLLHLDQQSYGQALKDFTQLIRAKEDFAPVYLSRAHAYFALADAAHGLADLSKYLVLVQSPRFDPAGPEAFALRGRLLRRWSPYWNLRAGARKETLSTGQAQLQKAIDLRVRSAAVFEDLGAVWQSLGSGEKAIDAYTRGLHLDPANFKIRVQRGWAYALLAQPPRYDLAQADFDQAVSLEPTNAEAHTGRGYVCAVLKLPGDALREADLALLHGGEDYGILHNVAGIHATLSQSDPTGKDGYQKTAVAVLARAVRLWNQGGRAGPNELQQIQDDPAFDCLRRRPDYKELFRAEAQ